MNADKTMKKPVFVNVQIPMLADLVQGPMILEVTP
jgi:hypothetical protein